MNILMVTNTYLPHVGGVARSVDTFTQIFRRAGHNVLVLAPTFEGALEDEEGVARVPAIQNFNGSDFSVRLPVPASLIPRLEAFRPDIIHSHHPFLLGDTALRIGAKWNVPIVFTHHTMYERYTHYVPGNSPALKRYAIRLATGYANLCHHVIAPSESVREILIRRGVNVPISVVPTGINVAAFGAGKRERAREAFGISEDAYVVGHVGRLAPEKNLEFLAGAVALSMLKHPEVHFVVVGEGPSEVVIRSIFEKRRIEDRLHLVGRKTGDELCDAYVSMDLFAFASKTETQGMVVAEAMAAGLPVVALDAPGVREVVADGTNGALLKTRWRREFAKRLVAFYKTSPAKLTQAKEAARKTAGLFSEERCAAEALKVYEKCRSRTNFSMQTNPDAWEAALRRIETEWALVKSATRAFGPPKFLVKLQPLFFRLMQWRRRLLSRADWALAALRLERAKSRSNEPGLILIQIDGLSHAQLERGINRRRMPFLHKLLRREGYGLFNFYSGLPSTTPAVQGELFFGKRSAVPAFAFFDRRDRRARRMVEPDSARMIEEELRAAGEGLLAGGSSYSNVYTGGAQEAHLSPAAIGFHGLFSKATIYTWPILVLLYFPLVIHVALLLTLELVLALSDSVSGIRRGYGARPEFTFIVSRLIISILFRELVSAGAVLDIARGLPIVHLNFLGYDEQAHRRGPESFFAHWALKGIDTCIGRIWKAAKSSRRRVYQVWIYSDHGQEQCISYRLIYGRSIQESISEVLEESGTPAEVPQLYRETSELERVRWFGGKLLQRLLGFPWTEDEYRGGAVPVLASGPLGHVYLQDRTANKHDLARKLVDMAHVPLVLVAHEDGGALAFNEDGVFRLPDEAAKVLPQGKPHSAEVAHDLCALFKHPNCGDLIISGWSNKGAPMTFPIEHGAHGGPGANETNGFLCVPNSLKREIDHRGYLRPETFRAQIMRHMRREPMRRAQRGTAERTLRVMSYNVRSCRGTDGRCSPERIAEIISHYDPDVVCLQEVDVQRSRSGNVDQAKEIARILEMDFHFHPSLQLEEELYGDAVLSRLPIHLIKSGALPALPDRPGLETRGALWVNLCVDGHEFDLVNTHLGLIKKERELHVYELLGPRWLSGKKERVIFCGDLNAGPGSYCYSMLQQRFTDVQNVPPGHRVKSTWNSYYPLRRIDHIFVSEDLEPLRVSVPRTALTRLASDHLPVIAELEWKAF